MSAQTSTCSLSHPCCMATASSSNDRNTVYVFYTRRAGTTSRHCARSCAGMKGLLTMALRQITLRDFVIVQTLELDLRNGFTVLTGETGAGKSILIDALQLAFRGACRCGRGAEGMQQDRYLCGFDCPRTPAPGWMKEGLKPMTGCCCAVPSTRRARAARGSMAPCYSLPVALAGRDACRHPRSARAAKPDPTRVGARFA